MRNTDSEIVERHVDAGGMTHDLVVGQTDRDGWQELDVCGDTEQGIDTLADGEDGRPHAETIARNYLTRVAHAVGAARRAADEAISEGQEQSPQRRPPHPAARDRPAHSVALPCQAP